MHLSSTYDVERLYLNDNDDDDDGIILIIIIIAVFPTTKKARGGDAVIVKVSTLVEVCGSWVSTGIEIAERRVRAEHSDAKSRSGGYEYAQVFIVRFSFEILYLSTSGVSARTSRLSTSSRLLFSG